MSSDPFSEDAWNKRWNENNIGWHANFVHQSLIQHWNVFCPPDFGSRRVFVPLCGKSFDLEWLYTSKGCTVVGCDLSEVAIATFAKEHPDIHMKKSSSTFRNGDSVTVFQTADERLRLYVCDLFKMESSPEEPFNLIWDRGSFVALEPALRQKYIALLFKLSTPNVRWLQETLEHSLGIHSGPPCSISQEEFRALFEHQFNIETLKYTDFKHIKFKDAEYCFERLVLLTKK